MINFVINKLDKIPLIWYTFHKREIFCNVCDKRFWTQAKQEPVIEIYLRNKIEKSYD